MCCAHTHSTRCHVYERTGFRAHVAQDVQAASDIAEGSEVTVAGWKTDAQSLCPVCSFRQHMRLALFVRSDALFLIAGVLRSTLESPEATYGSKTKR